MAKTGETRLEMRARKLGDAVSRRVDVIATSLRPAGQRPSFTTLMNKTDLFNFVLKNVYGPQGATPAGQQYMQGLDPSSQLELHAALSQHIESQGLMGASPGGAQTLAAGPMGGPNAAV